ncbi:MAG: hypothetical protein HUJ54_13195 [Erysipelotrichaceae bacterium]|nr:hypothetical protein [Erysipelotrichaceae bacterium]
MVLWKNITSSFPSLFQNQNFLSRLQKTESSEFDFYEGLVFQKLPSLNEWLDALPERAGRILWRRLNDETLESIANDYGITRERVRQIQNKYFNQTVQIYPDHFSFMVQKYGVDKGGLKSIASLSDQEAEYLLLKYRQDSEVLPIHDMITDDALPEGFRKKVLNYTRKDMVLINGKFVPKKRQEIVSQLFKYETRQLSIDEILQRTADAFEQNNIPHNFYENRRAFKAWVENQTDFIVVQGEKARYYRLDELNVEYLVKQLRLDEYHNVILSVRLFFDENPELMKEFNILDEYELHYILRNTQDRWNPDNIKNLTFGRMPTLEFGKGNVVQQIQSLVEETGLMIPQKIAAVYEEKYGVRQQTFLGNNNNILTALQRNMHYQPYFLSDHQKNYLREHMTSEFLLDSDIKNICSSCTERIDFKKLNWKIYEDLGYRKFSGYAISSKWKTSREFFTHLFTSERQLDLRSLPADLGKLNNGSNIKFQLLRDFKIFQADEQTLINEKEFKFLYPGITPQDLRDFAHRALKFGSRFEFFTVEFLRKNGFEIDEKLSVLTDWQLGAVLRLYVAYGYTQTSGTFLFSVKVPQVTTASLVEYLMHHSSVDNFHSLNQVLEKDYGIYLSPEKLRELTFKIKLHNSQIYFSDPDQPEKGAL